MRQDTHCMEIKIASDYYSATLSVDIAENAAPITVEEIKQAIANKNITFGIETQVIDSIVESQISVRDVVIAKGIKHKNGENGTITYKFDASQKSKPTVNDDGSVDFKEMHFLNIAEEGQILATRTMPTEGINGTTVTGKVIPGRIGKIVNFKFGKNITVSEDGLSMIAERKGNIEISGNKISVISVLEINEDVGVATGNIDFVGDVIIRGDVTTGYAVKAEGNVVVNGIVEAAEIDCCGDLTIQYGVQGGDIAKLNVCGDLTAKFINNATVNCKKQILAGAIMHSEINCEDSIVIEGKSATLVGGDVYARYLIKAQTIGSEMGTITKVSLGTNDELLEKYHSTEESVQKINEAIVKLNQVVTALQKKNQATANPEDKLILEKTKRSRGEYAIMLEKAKLKLKKEQDIIATTAGAKVVASNLYPGTRIKISGSFYNTKTAIKGVRLVKVGGEIVLQAV